MKKSINSLINGVPADYINVNDRAVQYGDGIFETIMYTSGKLLYWQRHYQRLRRSAEKLNIYCPDNVCLLDDIAQLLHSENVALEKKSYVIKIILTRGVSQRGYKYTDDLRSNRIVSFSSAEPSSSSILSNELLRGELFLCEHQASINENLAGLKHLNRLENVLARNEWNDCIDKVYIDGLMLSADQYAIEGTMSNLFCVLNGQLVTPDLSRSGVNGIMRDVIVEIARENQLSVVIDNITVKKILTMDEIFISNSLIGIKSVTKFLHSDLVRSEVAQSLFNNLLSSLNGYAEKI